MTLESARWLGMGLTVQEYRQAVVGVGRGVVGERFAAGYRTETTTSGGAAEEGEEGSDEDGEDPVELQNGCTTATGAVAYAVRADQVQGLSTRSIDAFRTLSRTWNAFLGFAQRDSKPVMLPKRKQQLDSDSPEENRPARKRTRVIQVRPAALASPTYKGIDREEEEKRGVRNAVRQVLRISQDTPVTYKTSEQKAALTIVVRGVSPLSIVLPTGGGKTLLHVAAAILNDAALQDSDTARSSVTILVVPFRALIEDMLVRLRDAEVKAVEWQAGAAGDYQNRRTPASIVLISANCIGSQSLKQQPDFADRPENTPKMNMKWLLRLKTCLPAK
jgi:hypothetical protein